VCEGEKGRAHAELNRHRDLTAGALGRRAPRAASAPPGAWAGAFFTLRVEGLLGVPPRRARIFGWLRGFLSRDVFSGEGSGKPDQQEHQAQRDECPGGWFPKNAR